MAAPAAAVPPDARSVDSLVDDLKNEDPDVRLAAREELRRTGAAAVPALLKLSVTDSPPGRQARAILRRIEFDSRAAKAAGSGVTWFKWERKGGATAWVRLEAKKHDHGWTLVETVYMEEVTLTETAETDADFSVKTITSTLGDSQTKNEVKAEFREGVCVIEEKGKKDELPGVGPPWTDWSVVKFAGSIAADPPTEPEIVVWDSPSQDPGTTKLHVGEPEFTDGPGGVRLKAIPVKVEGMLTAWVKEDGTLSHATRGEGSMISPAEEKDVPEKFRK